MASATLFSYGVREEERRIGRVLRKREQDRKGT